MNLTPYFHLKTTLKEQSKALKDLLLQDGEYNGFAEDTRASREVLNQCKTNLIQSSPSIGSAHSKVTKTKEELKVLKESIKQSCKVVDSQTGETIQLTLSL